MNLYKLYKTKCPKDRPEHAFYLQPLKSPTADCWYNTVPIGHATLAGTIARICRQAGITGYKTNHSLRATAATRLYQAGIDEQLIMETTGHHSLEGVRSYKRTNTEQQESVSGILSLAKKRTLTPTNNDHSSVVPAASALSSATILNSQQLTIHPDVLKHMFTFNSCSNINIHLNIK